MYNIYSRYWNHTNRSYNKMKYTNHKVWVKSYWDFSVALLPKKVRGHWRTIKVPK